MKLSLRWRLTLFYVASMALLLLVLAAATYRHLDHELREEAVERIHPNHLDWVLHADFLNQEINDIVGELFEVWSVIALPMLVLSLAAGMWLSRRSLQPVRELNRHLAEIGPTSLSERVEVVEADPDLQRLAEQINGLLGRVENGYERLSSYSTTVAHELRTPIMLMRLQIERAGGSIEPDLAEDLQEELARLGDYIERTLLSARAEQGKFEIQPREFDLTACVCDLAEGHTLLAKEEGRVISVDAVAPVMVHSDPVAFRHIFDNLMANALRHGVGGIAIRVKKRGQNATLLIANRVSGEKSPANPGVGVGLRLVSALAGALPGTRYRSHHGKRWHAAALRLPGAETPIPEIRIFS
jgi:signal transduction histidine kinase